MDFEVGNDTRDYDETDNNGVPESPGRDPAETSALNRSPDHVDGDEEEYYTPEKPDNHRMRRTVSILCYVTIIVLILLIGVVIAVYFVKKQQAEKNVTGGHVGAVTSTETNTQQQAPSVMVTPETLDLNIGEEMSLTCRLLAGYPEPDFRWTHDGQEVNIDPVRGLFIRSFTQKSRLHIVRAQESDSGRYRCHAHNSVGEASAEANVSVAVQSHQEECNEQSQGYCYNGGTCFIYTLLGEGSMHCQCPEMYTGKRCEEHDISMLLPFDAIHEAKSPDKTPYMVAIAIIVLVLVVCVIFKVIYSYNYRRKHERQTGKYQSAENGNHRSHPNANGDLPETKQFPIT